MNREDVAMDVTVQNVEILRNRVAELDHHEQAEGAQGDACAWLESLEGDAWADACEEIAASVKKMRQQADDEKVEREAFEAHESKERRLSPTDQQFWFRRGAIADYDLKSIDDAWKAWKARAALAQPSLQCKKCGGTGDADSGGIHPWGEAAMVPCDCAHTEVAQGERESLALQELIRVREWVANRKGQPEKLKNTGQTYIMIEKCETLDMLDWAIEKARAALAQPSPAGEFGDAYQGAREDLAIWKRRALEAEQALREEKILTERLGNALNDDNGPTFMGEPNVAQPSPAPELERPEVVGRRCTPSAEMAAVQAYRKEPWVDDRITEQPSLPGFYSVEPLMTVAQHERIVESLQAEVLSWRETVRFNESCWAEERGVMIDKIQTIRGGIPLAIAAIEDGAVMITGIEDRLFKALSEHTHWKRKTASLELYAAPVAQAGQV
ncbi:hypothetical protein HBO32_31775, partial [Pseudomonas nitroreducens]|nr:hypothetical protein [Pseudomonas nitroreducens]